MKILINLFILCSVFLNFALANHLNVATWPTETLAAPVYYNQTWYKTSLGQQYLQDVYGQNAQLIDASKITYFYPIFPFAAMKMPLPRAAYYPQGVPLNKLWFPSFWPTQRQAPWIAPQTRAVRNIYSPFNGEWNHTYPALSGRVEIAHMTGDDVGWWAYYTPGSGIYLDLGKTVGVENKLDYLHTVMHLSYQAIAKLPGWDVPDVSNPNGNPNQVVFKHWTYLRKLLLGQTIIDVKRPHHSLTITATTPLNQLLFFAVNGNNKLLNTLGFGTQNIDWIIYDDAKKRGFHSVQFLTQPNFVGGWMTEIIFIVDDNHPAAIHSLESGIQLYNHAACQVRYIKVYPSFGDQDQGLLTCDNLTISQKLAAT